MNIKKLRFKMSRYKIRISLFFKPNFSKRRHLTKSDIVSKSPCGKYSLTIEYYEQGKGFWKFTKGVLRLLATGKIISEVERNYGSFWYEWIHHQNGKDYLFCGDDYQGYTIVNLSDETSLSHKIGFCIYDVDEYDSSDDDKELTVTGCYWGGQEERVVYDFSNPDVLPYEEKERFDIEIDYDDGYYDDEYED